MKVTHTDYGVAKSNKSLIYTLAPLGAAISLWPAIGVLISGNSLPLEMGIVWTTWISGSALLASIYYLIKAKKDQLIATTTSVLMFVLFMVANGFIFYISGLFALAY